MFWVFFSANDADPVVGLRVRVQAISVGHFAYKATKTMKIQASSANCDFQTQLHVLHCSQHARYSLEIGLQATFMVLVIGDWSLMMPISAYLSLAEEKNQISGAQIFSQKYRSVFVLRLQIAAFSRFRNRSVFGRLRFSRVAKFAQDSSNAAVSTEHADVSKTEVHQILQLYLRRPPP